MYFKLKAKINEKNYSIFVQDGFYSLLNESSNTVHKHNYSEIHVISGGSASFRIESAEYTVSDGELIAIPRGLFHTWKDSSDSVLHTAFMIDMQIDSAQIISADTDVIRGFFNEIRKFGQAHDHSVISAYIPLLLSYVKKSTSTLQQQAPDDGVLVENFFSTRYSEDIRLSDLASILHLSERQTERKIMEHTGHTFNEELSATRMAVARYLKANTDMSLSQISEYVGYKSYAGFWKAMKKSSAE